MGERGWTLHLHRVAAERARVELSALGFRGVVLAHDAAWCSVAALDWHESLGHEEVARALGCDALAVYFDDEIGVTFAFASPGGPRWEFTVPSNEPTAPSPEDLRFFAALAADGLVASGFGAELTRALAAPPTEARAWVDAHGVERLFGLPFVESVHPGTPLEILREWLPDAVEIVPVPVSERRLVPPPVVAAEAAPSARSWTDRERAIVALHQHYVTRVWQPNGWTIFNLYKRHLPADQRRRVEDLIGERLTGDDEAKQRAMVEAILALAWEGTDWLAVLRKPRILDEGLTDEERADWRRRLAAIAAE